MGLEACTYVRSVFYASRGTIAKALSIVSLKHYRYSHFIEMMDNDLLSQPEPKVKARGYHPFSSRCLQGKRPRPVHVLIPISLVKSKNSDHLPSLRHIRDPIHFQNPFTISVHPPKSHWSPCRPHCIVVPDCLFFFFFSLGFFGNRVRDDERELCSEPAFCAPDEQKE